MTQRYLAGGWRRAPGLPHRRSRRRAAIALVALAALAPLSHAALVQGKTTVGFWAGEAIPGTNWKSPGTYWKPRNTRAYTPQLWNVLRRNRIPLYFNLRYRRDFGPVPRGKPHRDDGLAIVRRANRFGVPVWGWVVIPYADGYWAWEGAAAEQFAAVKALARWTRAKRVRLRGIVLDPEPPLRTPFAALAATLGAGSDAAFPSLFRRTIDPAGQCAAWRAYERIPRWAKRHRISISAAPFPVALDDLDDGSLALQDAAEFVVPSAPWHELFFQAYRTLFAYYAGRDPGAGVVSSYLRSARREFGRVGQISLGTAGHGSYRRLSNLLRDVRLAATLGARDVPIYSLETTLRAYGGLRALVRIVRAARHPFAGPRRARATAPTRRAETLRARIRRADAAAVSTTATITAGNGALQSPNSWPGGCGVP